MAELRMQPEAELDSPSSLVEARELLVKAIEPCKVGRVSRSALERAEHALRDLTKKLDDRRSRLP